MRFPFPLRARVRLFLAAGSAGLLIGAVAGSAWLGGHTAQRSQLQYQAATLLTLEAQTAQAAQLLNVKNPESAQNRGALKRIKQAGFGDADLDRRALSLVMRYDSYASPVETLRLREQPPKTGAASIRQTKLDSAGAPVVQASMGMGILNDMPFNKARPASPFVLKNKSHSDLDCLTQAVYYEARGEGEAGQRAVAQVILNRVRHPAYPKTICNVVYQGADRRTGCQFSFTCSGVMGRRVESRAWKQAKNVAEAALNGYVAKSVGSSTHFHTLGVHPVWRHRMDHIATVGNHAFYQFPGKGARMVASAEEIRPSAEPATTRSAAAQVKDADRAAELVAVLDRQAASGAEHPSETKAVKLSAPVKGADAKAVVTAVSKDAEG